MTIMDTNSKKILLIDNEKCVRDTISLSLEKLGYRVVSVESGKKAIKLLKEEPVDIVICDIVMPDISGMDTLEHIVSNYPHIPVIMLSGLADSKTAMEAMKKQAFAFLAKPVQMKEIQKVIERAIDYKQKFKDQ